MTRYIIKVTNEATEKNPNFKGHVRKYYYGKNQKLIGMKYFPEVETGYSPDNFCINEYSFTTKAVAIKALKAHQDVCTHENTTGFWDSSCEIVEVNI